MKFSTAFFAAATSLIFSGGALAQLTPATVVANINIVTSVSGNLNSVLGGLSTSTTPANVQTMSQTVITDFTTIINDLAADVTAMQATSPFTVQADVQLVVTALNNFVGVHQQLLATVIGKHGIFAQFGVTAPIAAILRSLEAGIDSFAYAMIALIPSGETSVTNNKNSLDGSVTNTITLYTQLCISSPLYPGVMPICVAL
ncbi:hypothetical protein K438DRAFT_1987142 [Mycena galopus ATCC 62051]|nr:hypothetical protein K438DRAFT_1987141 [Mycena galopus ATCC 62051]KAF8155234.1 hypothetical protein K438DRAFT_1987142 [Mycena galopus ATCC 62051]